MEQARVFHAPLLFSRGQCAGGCFSRYRLTRTHTAATAVSTPTITSPAPSSSKPGGADDETSLEPTRSKQNTDRTGADGGCPTSARPACRRDEESVHSRPFQYLRSEPQTDRGTS